MNKIVDYIRERNSEPKTEFLLGSAVVYVKESLPEEINLEKVLHFVNTKLPHMFYDNVEMVYIGNFPFLISKQIDALYENGAIFLSSKTKTEYDLMCDLVHEIAHAFEHDSPELIYGDSEIESEFLGKRTKMAEILASNGYKTDHLDFENLDYDKEFDLFLYDTIGYETLANLTSGLFISPYAATSLREYFANSFEEFFIKDIKNCQTLTPSVHKKLLEYLEF